MRNTVILAAVAALALSTPALAQTNAGFVGTRAEVTAGLSDTTNDRDVARFAGTVGADAPLGERFILGLDATAGNESEFGASARLGYAVNPNFLVYARAGYAHQDNDGATVGAGTEFRVSENVYYTAQYKYTDFEQRVDSHGFYVGVGRRF